MFNVVDQLKDKISGTDSLKKILQAVREAQIKVPKKYEDILPGQAAQRHCEECSICLALLTEDLSVLPCNHVFHTKCINKWSAEKNRQQSGKKRCPYCRNPYIDPRPVCTPATGSETTVSWVKRGSQWISSRCE
mmetsp:Transcript_24907/g.35127  ORF Transcript_24907/g.35127 Transcript_24907/m.35127 type:complete len:134 (+) Transcript_24907:267-668(+)